MKKNAAISMLLAASIALSGCASTSTEDSSVDNPTEQSDTSQEAPSFFSIGDSVDDGSGVVVTLKGVRSAKKGLLGSRPDNDLFLVAELEIENTTDEEVTISTLLSINLAGDSGREYPLSLMVELDSSLDATIKPGRKLLGEIAFDASDDTLYYLTVQPSLFGDSIEFQFGPDNL